MTPQEQLQVYLNFVILAVMGRMGQADAIVRRHGDAVRAVAQGLRHHFRDVPAPRAVYRGLLLTPAQLAGSRVVPEPGADRQFESFSEGRRVACWFADPGSFVSGALVEARPNAQGYLLTVDHLDADSVLWNWRWPGMPGLAPHALVPWPVLADQYPGLDAIQWAWNYRVQQEIITEPITQGVSYTITRFEDSGCPPTEDLDEEFVPPTFRVPLLGILSNPDARKPVSYMTEPEARAILGLPAAGAVDLENLKTMYRTAVKSIRADLNDPEAVATIQRINEARDVILGRSWARTATPTSGAPPRATRPRGGRLRPDPNDARTWRFGPKPDRDYVAADIEAFARAVQDHDYRQVLVRERVQMDPMDATYYDKEAGVYRHTRPFGSKRRTWRIRDWSDSHGSIRQAMNEAGLREPQQLLTLMVTDGAYGAWATGVSEGRYVSVNFEEVPTRKKKTKGALSRSKVEDALRAMGWALSAGGAKNAYWAPRGQDSVTGKFLRLSKRAVRPVERHRRDRKIHDFGLTDEVYYGSLDLPTLEQLARKVHPA